MITIIANIITIVFVNFFRIHLHRTLKCILILLYIIKVPVRPCTCPFKWPGQTYPWAFETCKMKKVFVDFKSKSNYSSLASKTFFHKFMLKANWAHVSMVGSANGMKMILLLGLFYSSSTYMIYLGEIQSFWVEFFGPNFCFKTEPRCAGGSIW